MEDNNRKELYSLSNQLIEIFIADVMSKHQVNINELKERLSDEQRDRLRETVSHLKDQVEDFLSRDTLKTVTEEDNQNNEQPASPLREMVLDKKQVEKEPDATE